MLTGTDWYPTSDPRKLRLPPLRGRLALGHARRACCCRCRWVSARRLPLGVHPRRVRRSSRSRWSSSWPRCPRSCSACSAWRSSCPGCARRFGLSSGLTAFSAGLVVGVLCLPTIISISEDALHAVPDSLRQGSLALGNTHWQTTYKVVVPAASSGIFAAVMLGLGRAIGETMVVLMLAGNSGLDHPHAVRGGAHADRHDRRRDGRGRARRTALLGAVRDGARAVRRHVRREPRGRLRARAAAAAGGVDEAPARVRQRAPRRDGR